MKILAIDTSNQTLAIGISEDGKMLGQYQTTTKKNHGATLMPAIEMLMDSTAVQPHELDRIVVAKGPGSYTGIRIGVTTAKTLAQTLGIDLVGVSSLETLASNCAGQTGWIVPIFDARRENVYAGIYEWQGENLVEVLAEQHISLSTLLEFINDHPVYFVGEDCEQFKNQIQQLGDQAKINSVVAWNYPNGTTLANLGRFSEPEKEVHLFLPDYLKRVEAEEKWLETHEAGDEEYVEKI